MCGLEKKEPGALTLYTADAMVRVPTLLEFLETQATLIASMERRNYCQWLEVAGEEGKGLAYGSRDTTGGL